MYFPTPYDKDRLLLINIPHGHARKVPMRQWRAKPWLCQSIKKPNGAGPAPTPFCCDFLSRNREDGFLDKIISFRRRTFVNFCLNLYASIFNQTILATRSRSKFSQRDPMPMIESDRNVSYPLPSPILSADSRLNNRKILHKSNTVANYINLCPLVTK